MGLAAASLVPAFTALFPTTIVFGINIRFRPRGNHHPTHKSPLSIPVEEIRVL
ncbi:hypothetical protein K504DRAFT_459459 [Pleomassaria siparia CBS 279.74]|uniref:Uncharacterized protein n=1 Tax=Pleomassaria siparia CBS 279.74 TaxID=1314801 RepID=A0A6G1K0T5_9PLEO|nr:hypothetical protein K504DRAFT_459459 [Pleomassaria siparia CBS 279.74]